MQVFKDKDALQRTISSLKQEKNSIGFVPTMGALHEGHLSLVKTAAASCDAVIVSIFINPTQFDNVKDLVNYPRTLDSDISLLETLNLNLFIFVPTAEDLYGNKIVAEHFSFDGLEHQMEGKYRTGHFNGVGTVVKRLFHIVQPDKAFFGEKDFQQLQIIKKLAEKSMLPVEIIGCPISRESNGLARSSRNERLSQNMREEAAFIYKTLLKTKEKFGIESASEIVNWVKKEFESHPELKLEYFEIAESDTLKTAGSLKINSPYRALIVVFFKKYLIQ